MNVQNKGDLEEPLERIVEDILNERWKELIIPQKDGKSRLEKLSRSFKIEIAQLRKFFEETQKAQREDELLKLIPMVKYAVGRTLVDKKFADFIEKAVTDIVMEKEEEKRKEKLKAFKEGMKYIVAYARFFKPTKQKGRR